MLSRVLQLIFRSLLRQPDAHFLKVTLCIVLQSDTWEELGENKF